MAEIASFKPDSSFDVRFEFTNNNDIRTMTITKGSSKDITKIDVILNRDDWFKLSSLISVLMD